VPPLDEMLGDLLGSPTIESLHARMGRIVGDLGFSNYSYVDVRRLPIAPEPMPFFVTTLPPAFVSDYLGEQFVGYDPVVRRAATTNAPFSWSDTPDFHTARRRRPGRRSKSVQVMEFAREHGYTDGYIIPTHAVDADGHPVSALFSLYWQDDPARLGTADVTPVWLRLAAAMFQQRMEELRHVQGATDATPALTDREIETLLWACRGKTRNETAEILGITDRTVEFHFANAMQKLGVHNKFHAIAVAIQRRLIAP